ncbi:MAG: hypothetical protein FWG66_00150, partial [Spirochaetes bacterium]|nr:hypothetical protein [Spirochaetota bacterium]
MVIKKSKCRIADILEHTLDALIGKKISTEAFEKVFKDELFMCNELGLIGGETFAVDGLRLPS